MNPQLRGLVRLYVVLAGLWVLVWGYLAYDAHRVYAFNRDLTVAIDATPSADRRNYASAALHRDEFLEKRNFALKMAPIAPIVLPFAFAAGLWIFVGF